MRKKLATFLLILTLPIMSFSQNTVEITSDQLRITNLIFAEHAKLKQEIPLLYEKINNLEKIDSNWQSVDSLRNLQIELYNKELIRQQQCVNKLQDDLNKNKKITKFTIIGSIFAIVLTCIIQN